MAVDGGAAVCRRGEKHIAGGDSASATMKQREHGADKLHRGLDEGTAPCTGYSVVAIR